MKKNNCNPIMTVKGPIHPDLLGFCHSHEHLFLSPGFLQTINPNLCIDNFDSTVTELKIFRQSGGLGIVDAQPVGCGRMAEWLVKAAQETRINIIASTGFHSLVFYPRGHWIYEFGEDELIDLFTSECLEGMFIDGDLARPKQRIAAKCGVIKTATVQGEIAGHYVKLLTSAAKTSVKTGVPILSHTEVPATACEEVQLFLDNGLDPESIILCHLDRNVDDLRFHLRIAETGVYMEFDTIGRFKYHSDEDEVKFIKRMVDEGYEDKILLGLDTTRERLKSYGGLLGLDYIITTFIPKLSKAGITREVIYKFMVSNPAKAFQNRKGIKNANSI